MYRSISTLQTDLINHQTTCASLVREALSAIDRHSDLNAFVSVFETSALAQAERVDAKLRAGQRPGKLFGAIIGIKDNIVYRDHPSSAASRILDGFVSVYSATVVERLLAEDAIIIGRLNCDEFAMGGSNENSCYGPVLNPHNKACVSGGSSGGAAAAVAAGLCLAALGSDTGGSIRQPAAFCGIVGLKPTYGRVSRWGLIAYGSSFDQIGPMTNNVADAALILEVIAGADDYDATCSSREVPAYSHQLQPTGPCRIAYYANVVNHPSLHPEVRSATLGVIDRLKSQGHTVEAIELPELDYIVPAYYVLTTAEASSNLSRFDGVKYGFHAPDAKDLEQTYKMTRSRGFGLEVQRRIMCGTFVLSAGYYDAYYAKAQQVRRLVSDKTHATLEAYDLILSPTAPTPAYELGAVQDPVASFLGDIFTVQANIAGVPGISLPLAQTSDGMPIGIQFLARRFGEEKLLAFARGIM